MKSNKDVLLLKEEQDVRIPEELISAEEAEKLEGGIDANEVDQPSTGHSGIFACCNI